MFGTGTKAVSASPQQSTNVANAFVRFNQLVQKVSLQCVTVNNCDVQEPKRGQGTSAVFIARNRFAVLDKGSNQIVIKNLNNEITKKAPSPCATTDAIFYAGTGTLLCRSEDKVLCILKSPAFVLCL